MTDVFHPWRCVIVFVVTLAIAGVVGHLIGNVAQLGVPAATLAGLVIGGISAAFSYRWVFAPRRDR